MKLTPRGHKVIGFIYGVLVTLIVLGLNHANQTLKTCENIEHSLVCIQQEGK